MVIRHSNGRLVAIMAKHVDDLKITREKDIVLGIIEQLQAVFGKLKVEWHTFINCGVRHIRDPITKTITLDQDDYIKALKPIVHQTHSSDSSEAECDTVLTQTFMSLLGAAAYALLTRTDAASVHCSSSTP